MGPPSQAQQTANQKMVKGTTAFPAIRSGIAALSLMSALSWASQARWVIRTSGGQVKLPNRFCALEETWASLKFVVCVL